MEFVKKNLAYFIIGFIVVGIGTCNFIVNTNDEQKRIDNPTPGQYYVFEGYPVENKELIMKIKEVRENEIEFYISNQELVFGFKPNKSESAVRDADKKGTMFTDLTLVVPKSKIRELIDNNTLSGAVNNKAKIKAVFN